MRTMKLTSIWALCSVFFIFIIISLMSIDIILVDYNIQTKDYVTQCITWKQQENANMFAFLLPHM